MNRTRDSRRDARRGLVAGERANAESRWSRCLTTAALFLVAVCLLAAPAAAIVYVMPTDEEMVGRSPVIVYGEVVSVASGAGGDLPVTDAVLRVEEWLKGSVSGNTLVVRQPGGVGGDGRAMALMGLPMLAAGDRVLLFLEPNEDGYSTVELALGIFFETPVGGRDLLWREPSLQFEVEAAGGAGARGRYGLVRDSVRFRRWIASRVAGADPRASYFIADLPTQPQRIASPFEVVHSLPDCDAGSLPLRWANFDRGESVTVRVHGSQPGVPGGGMPEVLAATGAWNSVAGANVSLAASASSEEFSMSSVREGVSIGFEDPTGWLAGSWEPGGVLAAAVFSYPCYGFPGHTIPGTSRRAYALSEAWIATQDGFREYLSGGDSPGEDFAEVIAHELGHALGLGHACDLDRAGSCDPLTRDALMRTPVHSGGRGARLGSDDESAVRFLYPDGSAAPSPSPQPSPESDPEPQSDCTLVAPYWTGPTGGFTVRPAPGRTSVSLSCGGRTTEYSAEDGLVTRLVERSCRGSGLQLTGAAPGGWYWQHGDRNAAVAPLVCSEALGGPSAVVPGGVTAEATDQGTLIRHDTARLIGIVPHLAGNDCDEYVTPYWQGDGGVVVRPAEGRETVRVRVQCGRTSSTMTPSAGEDGVIAELVEKSYCTDDQGSPKEGGLTVTGAAPGGWYWVRGEANAAVSPLMCADLLGGPEAVDPGGVVSRATEDGTYFRHDVNRLIGVVPHLALDAEDN